MWWFSSALLARGRAPGSVARNPSRHPGGRHRDLFRAAVRDGTPLGQEARRYMDAGQLVPDEITIGLLLDRLGRPDATVG